MACVQATKMASAEQVGLNKTWELSLYELHRTPQDAITDNTEIAVSPRSLHSELMCPICLDMLKKTMTTKECLHRFCSDCIITALRSGNKVFPTKLPFPIQFSYPPQKKINLLLHFSLFIFCLESLFTARKLLLVSCLLFRGVNFGDKKF